MAHSRTHAMVDLCVGLAENLGNQKKMRNQMHIKLQKLMTPYDNVYELNPVNLFTSGKRAENREMFNKWEAQRWWGENYDRIMEFYNVQKFNQQSFNTPGRSKDGNRKAFVVMLFSGHPDMYQVCETRGQTQTPVSLDPNSGEEIPSNLVAGQGKDRVGR
ncbi:Protein BREVIS RADIX [Forsythia ovata]|uniref:Protein BREVIS RADIX n=1 Tax=Forsythia ovata TaxID=205694 RepID=A0ABD1WL62_9LAMI